LPEFVTAAAAPAPVFVVASAVDVPAPIFLV